MESEDPVYGPPEDGWSLNDVDELDALERAKRRTLPEASVSTDELFHALGEARNRYVLTYLLVADRPVPCYELVEYVVQETEPPEGDTRAEFRGRILTELLHTTCPKLDDVGLLEFDDTTQLVAETDQTVVALPHLRLALKRGDLSGG